MNIAYFYAPDMWGRIVKVLKSDKWFRRWVFLRYHRKYSVLEFIQDLEDSLDPGPFAESFIA